MTNRTALGLLLLSLLSVVACSAPDEPARTPVAAGEPRPEGKAEDPRAASMAHYERGLSLYQAEDYAGAVAAFQSAYDLLPNYRILYTLGIARRVLGDRAGAVASLEAYLSEGAAEIPATRRVEAERVIGELRRGM
jgi:tetratricopeptide (TPR) repeat protein